MKEKYKLQPEISLAPYSVDCVIKQFIVEVYFFTIDYLKFHKEKEHDNYTSQDSIDILSRKVFEIGN